MREIRGVFFFFFGMSTLCTQLLLPMRITMLDVGALPSKVFEVNRVARVVVFVIVFPTGERILNIAKNPLNQ